MILMFLALMAGQAQSSQTVPAGRPTVPTQSVPTQTSPTPANQAVLLPCDITPEGYVCRFPGHISAGSASSPAPANAVVISPAETRPVEFAPTRTPEEIAEAQRQERLINRCADAPWYSLCLPEDRREARRLRDAALARTTLRGEVTQLLSENKCEDAVRTALAGGDMDLAREARDFCAKP